MWAHQVSLVDAGVAFDGCALLAINIILWIISLFLGKTWPVDFIWSGYPPLMCVRILVGNAESGLRGRQLIVVSLVAVWAFRLTHNFVARGGIGHEDCECFPTPLSLLAARALTACTFDPRRRAVHRYAQPIRPSFLVDLPL